MLITLEERFSAEELAAMFTIKGRRGRMKKAKKASRGFRKAIQPHDHIAEGVSVHPPGKNRVADLAAFYEISQITGMEVSPFNI
jgi:hypothetical protein